MPKRYCTLNDNLKKLYPFLEKRSEGHVFCRICLSQFSIASGGKHHIATHLKSVKHKKAALASSSSKSVTSFVNDNSSSAASLKISLTEGTFMYHNLKHAESFRDMDCLSKLLKTMFNPSYSCARTKSEAVIENVFYPWAMNELKSELDKVRYVTLYCDTSNHGSVKILPILVRYYDPENGISVKLLDLKDIAGENSNLICEVLLKVIENHNLKGKVVGFCADNTNTNFGGSMRKGTNNIFSKMKIALEEDIFGIGCAAHIVNNALQNAADSLPIDIETIVVKIYSYLHVYTVRVEELKDICSYVQTNYQQVLGFSRTRWLALLPAVDRLIAMFKPLKVYFLSQSTCPVILKNFFSDETAEFWLHFIKQQASIFEHTVLQIEGQMTTVFKVSLVLNELVLKFQNRIDDTFLSSDLLEFINSSNKDQVMCHVLRFYKMCVEYLNKWIGSFKIFLSFSWMILNVVPDWKDIQNSLQKLYLTKTVSIVDESKLYDEFLYLKSFMQNSKFIDSNENNVEERWKKVFRHFKVNGIPCENLLNLVELIMCLLGTNAASERVFSAMNRLWTSEKNQIRVSMLKSMLFIKTNWDLTCTEFYEKLSKNKDILQKIHGSNKYSHVGNAQFSI